MISPADPPPVPAGGKSYPLTTRGIAVLLIAAVILAGGGWWIGHTTAVSPGTASAPPTSTTPSSRPGPAEMTSGIPHGFTRDAAGAATAATTALQVAQMVNIGQIDGQLARTTLLMASADPTTQKLFQKFGAGGFDATSVAPMTVAVPALDSSAATVKVWFVETTASAPSSSYTTFYRLATVSLVWSMDDWKVQNIDNTTDLALIDATYQDIAPWTGGTYTFYTQDGA